MTHDKAKQFLESIYKFNANKEYRKAIDDVFATIDRLCQKRQFAGVDKILLHANVDKLSPMVIIGFLSITLPVKTELKNRADFHRRAAPRFERHANPSILDKYA